MPASDTPTMVMRLINQMNIDTNSGCWLWTGYITPKGYGSVWVPWRGNTTAHRAFYEMYRGRIAPDLVCDHLCRVRSCVNPWHIEVVTNRENILRGVGPTALNAKSVQCKHGHSLSGSNLIVYSTGKRDCRICRRERGRRRELREAVDRRERING